ncbi:MAG TPA: dihydroxyacetone kinase [Clostridiales bacterium]|nr:DAK2 domain-containing protein [Clostridia bacterium]MDD4679539.1 DAK2 domain-containing protein [Clostridia bacterium]HCS72518.1 dihydroxyacetone kinase [Clostridiales bacterium]
MFLSAAQFLEINKEIVNDLNVFPVPDGDTGTNMSLTMISAARELKALDSNEINQIAEAITKGSLKGARGNSGVILSQLIRGFARILKNEEKITTAKFAEALQAGSATAYKAVMKPVEGTILTVARVTAEEAVKLSAHISNFEMFYDSLIDTAKETLEKTPKMLPVLEEAGVVDSGGMGLVYIMMGQAQALDYEYDLEAPLEQLDLAMSKGHIPESGFVSGPSGMSEEFIEFVYCTEFVIKNLFPYVREEDTDKLKLKLERLGDSIVVVGDDELIKVHFHTNMPGKALQLAMRFGELSNIKIDNMKEQHQHLNDFEFGSTAEDEAQKDFGLVSVSMGEGIANIFKDLNADYIIAGGQTMNPSIEDILNAVDRVKAKEIFVLPNNSNIVLSARQAAEISDKKIHVIPTKTIPQGLAALIAFNAEISADDNIKSMLRAIDHVKSAQITYAVRDSQVNGLKIKQGDIMGIADGEIEVVGKKIAKVTRQLLDMMLKDGGEIVTILYGSDAKEEDTEAIHSHISENYPDVDVELLSGGQPLYYYILAVE